MSCCLRQVQSTDACSKVGQRLGVSQTSWGLTQMASGVSHELMLLTCCIAVGAMVGIAVGGAVLAAAAALAAYYFVQKRRNKTTAPSVPEGRRVTAEAVPVAQESAVDTAPAPAAAKDTEKPAEIGLVDAAVHVTAIS